jgi:succinate dehydrogenase/fumarate reductase flavoprotein subunit
MARRLEGLGGTIMLDTPARGLLSEAGRVVGVELERNGERMSVPARDVILAAGGFQCDRDLLRRHVGPAAAEGVRRAVPEVIGEAMRMGAAVGAATTAHMETVYGHLMPAPPCEIRWSNYLDPMLLSAYYAGHAVVVNSSGRRFTDEGAGEATGEALNAAARQEPGGLWAILDADIRRDHAMYELPDGCLRLRNLRYGSLLPFFRLCHEGARLQVRIDGLRLCRARGAIVVKARTIDDLAARLAAHGVDEVGLVRTLSGYNDAVAAGRAAELEVPRTQETHALTRPPFSAIKVAPGISMTYGGLAIDERAQVLSRSGDPIPGLRAVPGAAGGVHDLFYGGALASCGVFGMIAGADVGSEGSR